MKLRVERKGYEGGCWFCYEDDGDDLVFDSEFDTYVHLSCIRKQLQNKLNNDTSEADVMKYLLNDEKKV